jgi:hypothetical protein
VNATHVSNAPQVCRSPRRRLLAAGLIAGLVAALSGIPAAAGTSTDAEVTDAPGDANFINGQGAQSGHEIGPDTRPASIDNSDLRAVWFETAYSTTKVKDASGNVLRVEHRPTALLLHIQTQGPIRPLAPWSYVEYRVQATLPGCEAYFQLAAYSTPPDRASIKHVGTACDGQANSFFAPSPVVPSYSGSVSTITFPLNDANIGHYISAGSLISQPAAHVLGRLPAGSQANVQVDETAAGDNFTIGQDVPADIDCVSSPGHTECQA